MEVVGQEYVLNLVRCEIVVKGIYDKGIVFKNVFVMVVQVVVFLEVGWKVREVSNGYYFNLF